MANSSLGGSVSVELLSVRGRLKLRRDNVTFWASRCSGSSRFASPGFRSRRHKSRSKALYGGFNMSDDSKSSGNLVNNILQFPKRKKDAQVPPPVNQEKPKTDPSPKKGSKKAMAATFLAISLLTVAVNKNTFEKTSVGNIDLASNASSEGRKIASVQSISRDADWEMNLSNRLASAQIREIASAGIGRAATIDEKLRWGILEEKYTITYSSDERRINTILLQDPVSSPSYIRDRSKFLAEYGRLFENKFNTAKLKSVEKSDDKTVEIHTLFDKENKAKGEARFELDRHKRLISLKVEPVKI
jgi:hypothetical protein